MTQQIDLYIEESKKHEASGNIELELIAELNSIPQNRNAQVTQTAIQEQTSAKIATETQKCVQQEIANAPVPVATSKPVVKKCVATKTYRRNSAHNWWLALIAFLLFLHLIFKN